MAKKAATAAMAAMDKDHDEWQGREDVDRLLRADEVHQDKDRHKRAVGRLTGVVNRLTKKSKRSSGRSGGR